MDTYQKEVVVEHADGSGTNTVLIVIILLIIVGAGVWWFTSQKGGTNTQGYTSPSDINVDVKSSSRFWYRYRYRSGNTNWCLGSNKWICQWWRHCNQSVIFSKII
jgi:hypothetical protein